MLQKERMRPPQTSNDSKHEPVFKPACGEARLNVVH